MTKVMMSTTVKIIGLLLMLGVVMIISDGGCISVPTKDDSGSSNTVNPPTAPNNLYAVAVSQSQINLTWNDNSSDETGFKIERSTSSGSGFTEIATVSANTASYQNTGLTASTTYYYKVKAYNSGGSSGYTSEASAATQATPTNPPTDPSGLAAVAVSASQIDLSWSDNSSDEEGFKIERSATSGSGFVQIATVGANTTSYQNTSGLASATAYYYQVRAYNSVGNSGYTLEASDTTLVGPPPTAPSGLTAVATSSSQINLSWADNSSNEDEFRIERKIGAGGTYSEITTRSANVTTYSDTSLSESTTYYYKVRAYNTSSGYSSYCAETSATTQGPPVYNITGTVSYGGSKTGRIYIAVNQVSSIWAEYGTSIAATGAFTIRGVRAGSYTLTAWRDHLGQGVENASNPRGTSGTVNVVSGNVSGVTITMTDPTPPAPEVPIGLVILPGNNSLLAFWDTPSDGNGREIAEYYNIYTNDNATVNKTTYGLKVTVPAKDDGMFFRFIPNTTTVWHCITAVTNGVESAESTIYGPVTIGAPTGGYTVSGTVNYSGVTPPPSAVLIAGVYLDSGTGGPPAITYTRIAPAPANSSAYSFAGVPNGTYGLFAFLDMNNNGVIDVGDIQNTDGGAGGMITVNGANLSGQNQTLPTTDGIAKVETNHQRQDVNESYDVDLKVSNGRKLVVAVAIASGPGISSPIDINKDWDFSHYLNRNTTRPTTADTYTFNVTYSDSTTANLTASVSAVLDSFAQNLAPTTTGSNNTAPTFSWTAPSTPPTALPYLYSLYVEEDMGSSIWYYPEDSYGVPSTTLSVLYDVDSNASQSALTIGTLYRWSVRVRDANGNTASQVVTYQP